MTDEIQLQSNSEIDEDINDLDDDLSEEEEFRDKALSLAEWQDRFSSEHPLVQRLMRDYPAWLQEVDKRIEVRPARRGDDALLQMWFGGRKFQRCSFNRVNPLYVRILDPIESDIELLRNKLSDARPESLKPRTPNKLGRGGLPAYRFYIGTDSDYEVLKEITRRQLGRLYKELNIPASPRVVSELFDPAALEQLIMRFKRDYGSFYSQKYIDEERNYKVEATAQMREHISKEKLGELIAEQKFGDAHAEIKRALYDVNLLNAWDTQPIYNLPSEQLSKAIYDLLYGDDALDSRIGRWLQLLQKDTPRCWPTATYFLMMQDPNEFILVKPTFFSNMLTQLSSPLKWETRPSVEYYAKLRSLCKDLLSALESLGARDMLDVHSFLWLLGNKKEDPLVEVFVKFQQSPGARFQTKLRRVRAKQIQELLSDTQSITVDIFNREVWVHHSETYLNGKAIRAPYEGAELSEVEADELGEALDSGKLEVHGNHVWGETTHIYDPKLRDQGQKTENLRRAIGILNNAELSPLQKAEQIMQVRSIKEAIGSGLVMIFHPADFMISNDKSKKALQKLGYDVSSLEKVQEAAQDLKAKLGAKDFLELDLFLYFYGIGALGGIGTEGSERIKPAKMWWVNQRDTYEQERDGGYLWAARKDKRGASPAHWFNLTRLEVGDVLIHYNSWRKSVLAVSQVVEVATEALRPKGYPGSPQTEGYSVELEYYELDEAIPLKDVPAEWRIYESGGPFTIGGTVNQGYLFSVSDEFAANFTERYWERLPEFWPRQFRKRSVWLFQATQFDLSEEIKRMQVGDEDSWTVSRYRDSMVPGDVVILWQGGSKAGLHGVGELTSKPYEHVYGGESPSWVSVVDGQEKAEWRVDFVYTAILNEPLTKEKVLADPVLQEMQLFKVRQGTNFKVTQEEWAVLQPLIAEIELAFRRRVSFEQICQSIDAKGLYFDPGVIANYLLALQTKRFVILTGISGTGKTQLGIAVAQALSGVDEGGEEKSNYSVVAVRPDWTDNRGLLGYYNPLTEEYVVTPFLQMLLDAQEEIEYAKGEQRDAKAFFVILDEMNLARVEHYFSDFLSSLESGEALHLHSDAKVADGDNGKYGAVPERMDVPENVFFTGTVNVDETTYLFSPKVLDRAFTIELNRVELESFGGTASHWTESASLSLDYFPGSLKWDRKPGVDDWREFGQLLDGDLRGVVLKLNEVLGAEYWQFGYRPAVEIARFVGLAAEQAGEDEETLWLALDMAILEKVLPKLNGTQQELELVLRGLLNLITPPADPTPLAGAAMGEGEALVLDIGEDGASASLAIGFTKSAVRLPQTAKKLNSMLRRVQQQGFTSFIAGR